MRNNPRMGSIAVLCSLLCLLGCLTPAKAWAQTVVTYGPGCYECVEDTNITLAKDYCQFIGHEEEGYTYCREETYGPNTFCSLTGDACFNTEVVGGGGGSGGGGSCTVGWGSVCPAECFSCERDPFRN